MIEQTLTVVSTEGTLAYLKAEAKPACEGCNGRCGSQVFARLFGTDKKTFPYRFDEPLQVGQKVTLALDDSRVVASSMQVYLMPLLTAMLVSILLSTLWQAPEGWQIAGAVMGGWLGFELARRRLKRVEHEVKVIKIYPISLPLVQIDGD